MFISVDISKLDVSYCSLRSVSSHVPTSHPLHSSLSKSEFEPFVSKASKFKYFSSSNQGKCFELSPTVNKKMPSDIGVLDPKLYTTSKSNTFDEIKSVSYDNKFENGSKFMVKIDLTHSKVNEQLSVNIKEFFIE